MMRSLRFEKSTVWVLRLLAGGAFIVSGLSKILDPWGFIYKIEDYLSVWGWDVPRTIVLTGALFLSAFEFVSGLLMATGCYRKVVVRLMLALMSFMLPLTFYIWLKNPVEDCGCFGEFWILSNFWTFAKNLLITAAIITLLRLNRKVAGLYHPEIQWIAGIVGIIYIAAIGLMSYLIQPLADFRPYPEGSTLIRTDGQGDENMTFIYTKDGKDYRFGINELPDNDTFTFVRREGDAEDTARLAIFDPETDEDVTDEVLTDDGKMLLLVMSEPARADLSNTYVINELYEKLRNDDCEMVALIAAGPKRIAEWQNLSRAEYPCYMADDTQLKELVRGIMALVYVEDGTIIWKRTIDSIDLQEVEKIVAGESDISSLGFDGPYMFKSLSVALVSTLAAIWLLQYLCGEINRRRKKPDRQGPQQPAPGIKNNKDGA